MGAAPPPGRALSKALQGWKSFTARKANEILGRKGAFWQREYYDRLIRNGDELERAVRFVVSNPERAGLKRWKWVWSAGEDARTRPFARKKRKGGIRKTSPALFHSSLGSLRCRFSSRPDGGVALLASKVAEGLIKGDEMGVRGLRECQEPAVADRFGCRQIGERLGHLSKDGFDCLRVGKKLHEGSASQLS